MLLLLCACRSPAEHPSVPPPSVPPPSPKSEAELPECPPFQRADDDGTPLTRAEAVAFAEAFLRAAGYTDSPATCFADESVSFPIAWRRGQLQPKAYATKWSPRRWAVVFLNSHPSPDQPDLGRAVLIDNETGRAEVAHKPAILKFFDRVAP